MTESATIVRIIVTAQATVVWSTHGGARTNPLDTVHEGRLNLWFADFSTADWQNGSGLTFTFF
jgi:prepilin-type processing-associated H-X9-DG protein